MINFREYNKLTELIVLDHNFLGGYEGVCECALCIMCQSSAFKYIHIFNVFALWQTKHAFPHSFNINFNNAFPELQRSGRDTAMNN